MIYYEKDYYAVPDTGAEKAYELLRQSLLFQKKVAIAKTVIVAIPKTVPKMKLDENELDMAKMLIGHMTKPFKVDEFQDEYQARLREAIMKKI